MDLKILQLIKYVEGIETTDTGIVIRRGEPVSSGGYFAKSAVNGIVSMDSVYVDEKKYTGVLTTRNLATQMYQHY